MSNRNNCNIKSEILVNRHVTSNACNPSTDEKDLNFVWETAFYTLLTFFKIISGVGTNPSPSSGTISSESINSVDSLEVSGYSEV